LREFNFLSQISQYMHPRTDNQCWRRWKHLKKNEVPLYIQKVVKRRIGMVGNFVGRERDRPELTEDDFIIVSRSQPLHNQTLVNSNSTAESDQPIPVVPASRSPTTVGAPEIAASANVSNVVESINKLSQMLVAASAQAATIASLSSTSASASALAPPPIQRLAPLPVLSPPFPSLSSSSTPSASSTASSRFAPLVSKVSSAFSVPTSIQQQIQPQPTQIFTELTQLPAITTTTITTTASHSAGNIGESSNSTTASSSAPITVSSSQATDQPEATLPKGKTSSSRKNANKRKRKELNPTLQDDDAEHGFGDVEESLTVRTRRAGARVSKRPRLFNDFAVDFC
jgi:hypothetical protein